MADFKPIEVVVVPDESFVPIEVDFTPPQATPVAETSKPATGKKES